MAPLLLVFALSQGCNGRIGGSGPDTGSNGSLPAIPNSGTGGVPFTTSGVVDASAVQLSDSSALRRLTRTEYDNTLEDLLGDHTRPGSLKLPEEVTTPDLAFDTNLKTQQPDAKLISSAETLAQEAAARAFRDPAARKFLVPCTPSGAADAACLKQVVSAFGRRAFRRPLSADEVDRYLAFQPFAVEAQDFYVAAELVVRAMLQEPEFLYRLEVGTADRARAGLFKLNGSEMATRLSYFLRGTTPDQELLKLADADQLGTPEQVRAAAARLISDPRVRDRVQDFHGQWLSYKKLQLPTELAAAMQAETKALLDRVIFDKPSSYLDVFSAKETFIDATLAELYGLPSPGAQPGWVPYGKSRRLGILSHGSTLAATSKATDSSPTLRGRFISTRLMCRPIPPPPPNVNADAMIPADAVCKKDKIVAQRSTGTCGGCHVQMDPIGFGLENYDREGRFRAVEDVHPECSISGEGNLPDVGAFNGADGLAVALLSSGRIQDCVVREVYRFALGRDETDAESAALQAATTQFNGEGQDFRQILVSVAAMESFGFRYENPKGTR